MLIYLDIKIPHLHIAHEGGNLEVGNIKIHLLRILLIIIINCDMNSTLGSVVPLTMFLFSTEIWAEQL